MAQLQEQLLAYLPSSLKSLVEGGSRRELIRKVDATVLLYDDAVVHLESRLSESLPSSAIDNASAQGLMKLDPSAVAAACKRLLSTHKDPSILLLLPTSEFAATAVTMPGMAKESLVSALKLQADSMLPALEESVAVAINSSTGLDAEHTALWISDSRISEFFDAFAKQDLFLAALKPRVLAIPNTEITTLALDSDQQSKTAVLVENGVVKQWLHVNKLDFTQQEFSDQWKAVLAEIATQRTIEFDEAGDYFDLLDKTNHQEYSYFPEGALKARKRVEKGKQLVVSAAAVALALLLAATPFVMQSFEFRNAAARLERQRDMSEQPRQDQAMVVNFENQWGAINDFPEQNIREAMFSLLGVLSPDRLSSMEISEGLIKIQGTSTDPQALLERLEQNPMFTEVIFSRATNNSRYYIDLRLATVNFEAYMVRYFPDA